ncbi:hypothetical protein AMS68_003989 [Peltaster fructicola]|uniref:Protein DOM34 homolog n=1 Tax=Peltaster fructicola TaxID=286661 RepID=A0A6H0XUP3_9PEZI|nr:hypothetical protein AMS68_003989 [Peltaster fructicola]
MRLIKQDIDRDEGSGSATLLPEEPEDIWHAYNLIRPGDFLRASTIRKVGTESAAGAKTTQRVHITLTIRVEKLDFDAQVAQLHVAGKVAEENTSVSVGSYHTLDLALQRNFTLRKEEGWDSIALETLQEATSQVKAAQLWAVIMQEGIANIGLVTEHQSIRRQHIEINVPKKRAGSTDRDKQLEKFYQTTFDTLLREIDLTDPKPLLIASPGFTAASFRKYIENKAADNKQLRELLPKITVAHSASGHFHSLSEVLRSPAVTSKLSDAKFAREAQLMDKFFDLMRADDMRAWYGPKESQRAIEMGAVGKGGGVLLISNGLFRSQDIRTRQHYVRLVDEVKDQGGEVRVLSSMHESGQRLENLSGIAVILTYPVEDLDEDLAEQVEDLTLT